MKKRILKTLAGTILLGLWAGSVLAITCTPEGDLPTELQDLLTKIRDVLAGAGVIIAGVYIILGGLEFMRAEGDPDKAERAKNRILYALIGVGLILLAVALVGIVKAIVC
jgi:uncharacterized membrane protein YidH (DUF202 family)